MRVTVASSISIILVLMTACNSRQAVQCEQSSDCDLSTGGSCLTATTGNAWCAYPDPSCPGGYRYSTQSVGDGLAGQCVPNGNTSDAGIDAASDAHPDAQLTWSAPTLVANVNTTADEAYPAPSANDLELYFSRLSINPPYGDIYVAKRSTTGESFGTPTAVTEVNGGSTNEIFAVPSHSGKELFVSVAGAITAYSRSSPASQWGTPMSTGIIAQFVSLSSDDLTMYFLKRCPSGVDGGNGPCVWASTRPSIGGSWGTPANILWDGSAQWNSADVSGDGLRMLVSQNYSGSGIPVAEQNRADTTEAWTNTQVISPLDVESTNQNAKWNASENEIYLVAQPSANAADGTDIYVSVLQ